MSLVQEQNNPNTNSYVQLFMATTEMKIFQIFNYMKKEKAGMKERVMSIKS